jgi:hypothetical protein
MFKPKISANLYCIRIRAQSARPQHKSSSPSADAYHRSWGAAVQEAQIEATSLFPAPSQMDSSTYLAAKFHNLKEMAAAALAASLLQPSSCRLGARRPRRSSHGRASMARATVHGAASYSCRSSRLISDQALTVLN